MQIFKVNKPVDKKFEPVTIEMTFESKEEQEEFYSVFCYTPITDSLKFIDDTKIRKVLSTSEYGKMFDRLTREIRKRINTY